MKTVAQVNKAIALLGGWTHEEQNVWIAWIAPDGMGAKRLPPDYCGDWRYAGSLLSEFIKAHPIGITVFTSKGMYWATTQTGHTHPPTGEGTSDTEAIARAYLAWKEQSDAKT